MWKKILLTLIGLIGLAIGVVIWMTSGMSENANIFFNTLLAKDYKGAYYGYISKDFQKKVSLDEFIKFVKINRLDQVNETSWNSRKTDGNMGELEGFVTTIDKSKIPIKIDFIKENDTWRIYGIFKKNPTMLNENSEINLKNKNNSLQIPSDIEIKNLIKNSVKIFTESLAKHDMTNFYNHISKHWRDKKSVNDFNQIFEPIMKFDFRIINKMEPIIEDKKITQNGLLDIVFYYNTKPDKLELELEYINENGNWKLILVDIHKKIRN